MTARREGEPRNGHGAAARGGAAAHALAAPTALPGAGDRADPQGLLSTLQRQVADLRAENAALSRQVQGVLEPRSAEDLAAAVQHSADQLQQRLGATRNAVSSFALKELRIEASVFVEVSPIGTIAYRFPRPGEPVEPAALTRLTMDLVPLPKDGALSTWTPDLFQPGLPVDALPDLGQKYRKLLEANGVFTVGDLLDVGTRARATTALVSLLGVERSRLAGWIRQAELLTLKGTNGATVLVLVAAGFPSLAALAAATPEAVLEAYGKARQRLGKTAAVDAKLADARAWVEAARRWAGREETPGPVPVPAPR